jgi:cell division protein FtsB
MTLGLHDYERRRRRRFWGSTVKFLLLLGVLLAIGLFAYQMGVEQVKAREAGLLEENAQLTQANGELSRSVAGLRAAAQNAETKAAELEARLARELPTGDLARLTELARERLAAGVEAKRLVFVLSQIRTPRACEKPENKRFILPTPVYKGPNSTVGFANGAITVSGEGAAARSATGNTEGWFDPKAPVTIRFTEAGGRQTEARGALPLHHVVVAAGIEHQFTVTAGARSFVEVTDERCPFP